VTVGDSVSFSDTSTGAIDTWSWDFDDLSGGSSERNPTHTFLAPGFYNVRLTVTGPGGSDSVTHQIEVVAVGP
jgi:PKD repeat protein